MSDTQAGDFDSMREVEAPETDDESDAEWLNGDGKLEPGEVIVGTITKLNPDAGDFGSGTVELVAQESGQLTVMWGNSTIWNRFEAADVGPGTKVGIKKHEDESVYTDDDGNEQTFHEFEVRVE